MKSRKMDANEQLSIINCPLSIETHSPAGTLALGKKIAARLARGDCVSLVGTLGAGKTVLVRGIAAGLGVSDKRLVSSPTFVLVQEYLATLPIFHLDLYRMCDAPAELADLGLDEMLQQGVVLIEWADKAPSALPKNSLQIEIQITGQKSRRFTLKRLVASDARGSDF
jgi:tRNA threonylcarbamoyladenosine biosynthesis protein TsaE